MGQREPIATLSTASLRRVLRATAIGLAMPGPDGGWHGSREQLAAKRRQVEKELRRRGAMDGGDANGGFCAAEGCVELDEGDGLCREHARAWRKGERFLLGAALPPDSEFREQTPDDSGGWRKDDYARRAAAGGGQRQEDLTAEGAELAEADEAAMAGTTDPERNEAMAKGKAKAITPEKVMCRVPACEGRVQVRGLCSAHYWHYRHGKGDKAELAEEYILPAARGRGGRRQAAKGSDVQVEISAIQDLKLRGAGQATSCGNVELVGSAGAVVGWALDAMSVPVVTWVTPEGRAFLRTDTHRAIVVGPDGTVTPMRLELRPCTDGTPA